MKRFSKIIFIFFTLLFILITTNASVFAAINLNINASDSNSSSSQSTTNTLAQQYGNELDSASPSTITDETSAADVYSTLSALPESSLGLSNILSILLIAIGVVLILLGIAVLLRLKK